MSIVQDYLGAAEANPLDPKNIVEVSFLTDEEWEHEQAVTKTAQELSGQVALENLLVQLETQGGVSKEQAVSLEARGVRLPRIQSYTAQPSRTNYQVTLESVLTKIGETVKKIWETIINFFRRLFSFGKKSDDLAKAAKETATQREKNVKEHEKQAKQIKEHQTEVKQKTAKMPDAIGDTDFSLKHCTPEAVVYDRDEWTKRQLAITSRIEQEARAPKKAQLQEILSYAEAAVRALEKGEDKDGTIQEAIRALADLRPVRDFQRVAAQLARADIAKEISVMIRSKSATQWERLMDQMDRKLEPALQWANKLTGEKRTAFSEFFANELVEALERIPQNHSAYIQPRNIPTYLDSVFKEVPSGVEDAAKDISALTQVSGDPIREIEKIMQGKGKDAALVSSGVVARAMKLLRCVQTVTTVLGHMSARQLRYARVLTAYENRVHRTQDAYNLHMTGLPLSKEASIGTLDEFESFMKSEDPLKL